MNSVLSNLAQSISGSVDKALLCVKKPEAARLNTKTGGVLSNVDLRSNLVQNKKNFITGFTTARTTAKEKGYHVLQVKYNPGTLKFSGSAENRMEPGPGGAAANMQVQSMMPAGTHLTVQLLFDDENHQDAFMWDKMTNLSAGAVISDVSGVVTNLMGDDGYTVQREIEGLIALITQSETRQVVFYWGDTAFAGIITQIQAKYTMFNPLGHPVRGVVTLTMHQGGYDADNKGDDSYWNEAFNALSNEKEIQSKVTGAVGNLLNLN